MQISKNNPVYFLTAVTHNRIPVFRTDKRKRILSTAFNEARISGGFLILAYVLMADHFHIITSSEESPSETLRYLKGISARRVIGYLKENGFEESLVKLRTETKPREYKHSLWQHNSNTFQISSEVDLLQKTTISMRIRLKKDWSSIRTSTLTLVREYGIVGLWMRNH